MFSNSALSQSLLNYQTALSRLEIRLSEGATTIEDGIAVLRSRTILQSQIDSHSVPSQYLINQLSLLDKQLRKLTPELVRLVDFSTYRTLLSIPSDHWWWHLDEEKQQKQAERYGWLWRGSRIILWTTSLGLLADIIRRFVLGGIGVAGASAISFASLLTLLNANSELTEAGQTGLNQLFKRLKIPSARYDIAKLGATSLLSLFMIGVWLLLPSISALYNLLGYNAADKGRLGSALQNYQRSIALNPDNKDAYYNLGVLYEDLRQFEEAEANYLIAVQGGVPQAYNNLGRLYLNREKPEPDSAVFLLTRGLKFAETYQDSLKKGNDFFVTQYNLFKNLGWARLIQERYEDGEKPLRAAVGLLQRPEAAAQIRNPASAHCLLAQVLEGQGDESAIDSWQQCYRLGNSTNPDEDAWMFQACQKLKEENRSCDSP